MATEPAFEYPKLKDEDDVVVFVERRRSPSTAYAAPLTAALWSRAAWGWPSERVAPAMTV